MYVYMYIYTICISIHTIHTLYIVYSVYIHILCIVCVYIHNIYTHTIHIVYSVYICTLYIHYMYIHTVYTHTLYIYIYSVQCIYIHTIYSIHNGIYSDFKRKEIVIHARTQMNFDDIVLSKTSQSQKSKYFMIHLYEICRVVRSIGTKSRIVVASGVGEEEMGSCIEFQFFVLF